MSSHVKLLRLFSSADRLRLFSFGSGVDGAISIRSDRLLALLEPMNRRALYFTLGIELARCALFSLLPLLQMALLARTIARRLLNPPSRTIHERSVVSLGPSPGPMDPYFGAFLSTTQEPYNLLKIVAGPRLRAQDFHFIESALGISSILRLALFSFLQPILVISLLVSTRSQMACRSAWAGFSLLALREMRMGKAYLNRMLSLAFDAHLGGPGVDRIYFPMEGRTWERHLARTARSLGKRSYGYLHCALTPRHVSLVHEGFYFKNELPDAITTSGAVSARVLSRTFPQTPVRKGVFIRAGRRPHAEIDSSLLLFALTENIDESFAILQAVADLGEVNGYRSVVRLNPTTSTYRKLAARARSLGLTIFEESDPAVPTYCFFRSASVAIEYLRLGSTPVYIDIGDPVGSNCFLLNEFQGQEFPSLALGSSFASGVRRIVTTGPLVKAGIGESMANDYLDQAYDSDRLKGLDELS